MQAALVDDGERRIEHGMTTEGASGRASSHGRAQCANRATCLSAHRWLGSIRQAHSLPIGARHALPATLFGRARTERGFRTVRRATLDASRYPMIGARTTVVAWILQAEAVTVGQPPSRPVSLMADRGEMIGLLFASDSDRHELLEALAGLRPPARAPSVSWEIQE
jgi:hypothetical protein